MGMTLLVALAAFTVLFLLAVLLKDNSIVDIAWGPAFVLVAWADFFLRSGTGPARFAVLGMMTLWGLRLGLHLFFRNHGRGEDFRYAGWRRSWGRWFYLRSYVQVFLFQALMLWLISMPAPLTGGGGTLWLLIPGMWVWVIGIVFETLSDHQLRVFRKQPENRGKLMTRGLWHWSRHPNYFGEALAWWGVALAALAGGAPVWVLISPALITFLLLKVSGVPLLEKAMAQREGFAAYAAETPVFFPWKPGRFPWKRRH